MKTQTNKSRIMKNAWVIYRRDKLVSFRTGGMSFSFALRIAWKQEKENIEKQNRGPAKVTKAVGTISPAFAAYYANARSGQYVGD